MSEKICLGIQVKFFFSFQCVIPINSRQNKIPICLLSVTWHSGEERNVLKCKKLTVMLSLKRHVVFALSKLATVQVAHLMNSLHPICSTR